MTNLLALISKRLRSLAHMDPERDWIVLLFLSIIALATVVIWGAVVFDRVARGGVISGGTGTTTPVFTNNSLDAIRTVFKNRAMEEEKYRTGEYRYADPSR